MPDPTTTITTESLVTRLNRMFQGINAKFGFPVPALTEKGLLIDGKHTPDAQISLEMGEQVKQALGITQEGARVWINPRLANTMSAQQIIDSIKSLSIGAHQDDELFLQTNGLAIGALETRLQPDVGIVTMTNGVGSDRAENYQELSDREMFEQRCMEQEMVGYNSGAAFVINIPFKSSQVKDPKFDPPVNNLKAIFAACSNLETLYTHNPVGDAHDSHLAVAECVVAATRESCGSAFWHLFGGEVWGSLDGVAPSSILRTCTIPERGDEVIAALFNGYLSQIGTKNYPEALPARMRHLLTLARDASHVSDTAAAGLTTPGGRYYYIDMSAILPSGMSISEWVALMRSEATDEQLAKLRKVSRT